MSWYIDRSRNLKSVFESAWYDKLVDFAKDDSAINRYKNNASAFIEYLELSGKNPNAILTYLRDIGFIDADNNCTSFFKTCIAAELSPESIILLILLKRNDNKNDASSIKPFVVICKFLTLMHDSNFELKFNWNQCSRYMQTISNYDEIDCFIVESMVCDNGENPDAALDIWFNALLNSGMFSGTPQEVTLNSDYFGFVKFIATYGAEMAPNFTRDEYDFQCADAAYGLYNLFMLHPAELLPSIVRMKELSNYISTLYCSISTANVKSFPQFPNRQHTLFDLNRILYGAPGTGKTYLTAKYAVAILENKSIDAYDNVSRVELMKTYNEFLDLDRIVFTTFHQNYGYEDFIQGIRPDDNFGSISFKMHDGIFKKIVDIAMSNPTEDYVLIIDEINRANISKVFGELITLIEPDKRWGEENAFSLVLPSGENFTVPNNLYIIGTMNSADKSIALIDTALRRRFKFIEIPPNPDLVSEEIRPVFEKLNKNLRDKEFLGSSDQLIGHAYFINKTKEDLVDIFNDSIIPLLYEYFFGDEKQINKLLSIVLDNTNINILNITSGNINRIKVSN